MRFSIIIPVYNVEKYLPRCLDSCIHQDIPSNEYEIIIINDGSPDGSKAIAEEYAEKYPNIKLFNQENGGLSVARNNGFDKAKGKYVWFVDSDDWIVENCLSEIYDKMVSQDLDMLQIGYTEAWDDGTVKPSERGFFEGLKSGCETMKEIYIPAPAQFTIYKRSFLYSFSLKFFPGIYHEDAEFKPRALFFAKRFASLNKHVYYYYQRANGSIMSHYSYKRGIDMMTVCKRIQMFEINTLMSTDTKREFDYVISVYLNELFKGIATLESDERYELIEKLKSEKELLSSMCNSKKRLHRFEGLILSLNIPLGIFVFNKLR